LDQRIRNVEGDENLALRRRIGMALVVVGQMLPEGAIKGGSAMALRYGRGTRFTQDLDAARVQPLARFRADFEESLVAGWAGFTGRLVERAAPRPAAVPSAYVMQPFDVRLAYEGGAWCTVKFELGHNELGDADDPEHYLAEDLGRLFTDVGLEPPQPVPVMRADHQVAQNLHALSSPAANGLATWSTCSSWRWGWTSTCLRSGPRACGSSSTGGSRPGRRRLFPARAGTSCTRLQPRTSTCSRSSRLLSRG
jgi:hypothetical protein